MPAARVAVDPPTGARERELLGRVRTLRGRPPTRRGDGLVSTDAPDTDDPRIDALLIQHAYIERCAAELAGELRARDQPDLCEMLKEVQALQTRLVHELAHVATAHRVAHFATAAADNPPGVAAPEVEQANELRTQVAATYTS